MQEVLPGASPPETIIIRKDSPAAWLYRAVLGVMVLFCAGLGYRVSEKLLTAADRLLAVPGQVEKQGKQIEDLVGKVDRLTDAQADAAKDADVQKVKGDLHTLTGRVDSMETTVNRLVQPVGTKPGR